MHQPNHLGGKLLRPIIACLIRPSDLTGRLGGGLKRFVEIAARIHANGVRYVIIESEPFIRSFSYFGRVQELEENNEILGLHFPCHSILNRRVIGPVLFWIRLIAVAFLAAQTVKSRQANLVLAPGETLPEVLAAWISTKLTGRRGVVTVQNDPFLIIPVQGMKKFNVLYANYRSLYHPVAAFLEALIARIHTRALNDMSLVVVGRNLVSKLRIRGIRGIVTIPVENGVDFETIRTISPSTSQSDAIFVGRVDMVRGVMDLPRAWISSFGQQRSVLKLVFLGPIQGRIRAELSDLAASSNGSFSVLGPVSDTCKYSRMKSSRVLVLPSSYESFSLVTAEALACGIPVVCYNTPAVSEFFSTPAVSAVPVGAINALINKVKEILNDEDERLRLATVGMTFVSRYDWDKVAAAEAEIYRSLDSNTQDTS